MSTLDLSELGTAGNYALWSDNPSSLDLLAFSAIADTVASALLDDHLDPVVLGVSGRWGSGKTTVIQLVGAKLDQLNDAGSAGQGRARKSRRGLARRGSAGRGEDGGRVRKPPLSHNPII